MTRVRLLGMEQWIMAMGIATIGGFKAQDVGVDWQECGMDPSLKGVRACEPINLGR